MLTAFIYNGLTYTMIGDKYGYTNPNLPGALKYRYWEISAKEYYLAAYALRHNIDKIQNI